MSPLSPAEILTSLPDALIVCDQAKRVCSWNEAATRLWGWSANETLGHLLREFLPGQNGDPAHITGSRRRQEILRKDGTRAWVEVLAVHRAPEGPQPGGWIYSVRDLTLPSRSEDELHREHERTLLALRGARVGIWELDVRTGAHVWDEQMLALCGLPDGPGDGKSDRWKAIIHEDDYDRVEEALRAALRAGGPAFDAGFRIRRSDTGELRHLRAVGTVTRRPNGEPVQMVGISWDATSQREAEQERRQVGQELLQNQRLETLGTLADGIAHDLNTYLMPITAWTELVISQDVADRERACTRLQHVRNAANNARDLVRRILSFSRFEQTSFCPVRIADVVEAAARLLRVSLPPEVTLTIDSAAALPPVVADAGQLQQVILHLANNAVAAMQPRGGMLTIRLTHADESQPRKASLGAVTAGPYVVLEVADTGCGMDSTTQLRIFEPFYTTKKSTGGIGLGLSAVAGIVASHSGAIDVISAPEQGSIFRLSLPAAPAVPQSRVQVSMPELRAKPPHAAVIALVGDDAHVALCAQRLLQSMRHTVEMYRSAEALLARFETTPTGVEAVVADLKQRGMSGMDLVRHLRDSGHTVPVVITNAAGEHLSATELEALGPVAVVDQPGEPGRLAAALTELLRRERPANSAAR